MADKKHAGGRPTKYKEEYAIQAEKLCKKGFTDVEMADFFEVDERTINRWKDDHPEFCQSLKSGKVYCDDKVVQALYDRAMGYTITEEKEEDSEVNGKKTVKTVRQVAGDTTAQIFWLKNRQPKQWRDKQEIEQSGTVQTVTMSKEEYADVRKKMLEEDDC